MQATSMIVEKALYKQIVRALSYTIVCFRKIGLITLEPCQLVGPFHLSSVTCRIPYTAPKLKDIRKKTDGCKMYLLIGEILYVIREKHINLSISWQHWFIFV